MAGVVSLVLGIVFIVGGACVIKFRKPIRDFTVNSEKSAFGRAGQTASQLQTPNGIAFSGGVIICVGIFALINGIGILVH